MFLLLAFLSAVEWECGHDELQEYVLSRTPTLLSH